MKEISDELYEHLKRLGIVDAECRKDNVGESNYSEHLIQPWAIWLDWNLNPWDADILKRVLRSKKSDARALDYKKIIHICKERLRQIESGLA